jgi:predicted porin
LNNNGPQLSNVGLMIEEQLGGGFTAIPKLETEFKTEIPARRRYFAI